jgi:hypothetical protein
VPDDLRFTSSFLAFLALLRYLARVKRRLWVMRTGMRPRVDEQADIFPARKAVDACISFPLPLKFSLYPNSPNPSLAELCGPLSTQLVPLQCSSQRFPSTDLWNWIQ